MLTILRLALAFACVFILIFSSTWTLSFTTLTCVGILSQFSSTLIWTDTFAGIVVKNFTTTFSARLTTRRFILSFESFVFVSTVSLDFFQVGLFVLDVNLKRVNLFLYLSDLLIPLSKLHNSSFLAGTLHIIAHGGGVEEEIQSFLVVSDRGSFDICAEVLEQGGPFTFKAFHQFRLLGCLAFLHFFTRGIPNRVFVVGDLFHSSLLRALHNCAVVLFVEGLESAICELEANIFEVIEFDWTLSCCSGCRSSCRSSCISFRHRFIYLVNVSTMCACV